MSDKYSEYLSKNYVEKLLRPKLPRNKTLYNKVKGALSNEVSLKLESDWQDDYSHRFMPQSQMSGGVIDANAWGACLRMQHLGKLSDAYIEAWERRNRYKPDFQFFKVLEALLKEELYNKWKEIKQNPFLHNIDDSGEMKAERENSINEMALCVYVELGRDLTILLDRYGVQQYTKEKPKRSQRIDIVREIITKSKYLSQNPDSLSENGKAELATLFDHLNYYQIPLPEKRTLGTSTATWEDLAHVAKNGAEGSRENPVTEYKRVTAILYRDIHSKE